MPAILAIAPPKVNTGAIVPSAQLAATLDSDDGMTNQYNTKLSAGDEAKFQGWAKANPRLGNTYDYDARGFWKSGAKTGANDHGTDQFKKPNHITFSDQSMYHGVDGHEGGHWDGSDDEGYTFTPGKTNLENHDISDLTRYWGQNEAPHGNTLNLPSAP